MSDAPFACPDLTTFARLAELGLEAVGQRLQPDRAVLACRVVEPDRDAATQLRYWARELGLTPDARYALRINDDAVPDEWNLFMPPQTGSKLKISRGP